MKTISFIIPVYNEKNRLAKTFQALKELKLPKSLLLENIIFVDDGSIDNSKTLIKRVSTDLGQILKATTKLVSYPQNKGKGYAIKMGLLESTSQYSLFFDVDISTPLSEITKFSELIEEGTDVIVGTRKTPKSEVLIHQPLLREFLGQAFTTFTRKFLNIKVSDITCGFKAFSQRATRTIAPQMRINGWGYDAELLVIAQKEGFVSTEVPVMWANDPNSRVKIHKAIILTLKELFIIKWEYYFRPALTAYPNRMFMAFSRLASLFV